jgi:hypothetical protein
MGRENGQNKLKVFGAEILNWVLFQQVCFIMAPRTGKAASVRLLF